METDQRNWWLCVVPKYPIRRISGAYEATRKYLLMDELYRDQKEQLIA